MPKPLSPGVTPRLTPIHPPTLSHNLWVAPFQNLIITLVGNQSWAVFSSHWKNKSGQYMIMNDAAVEYGTISIVFNNTKNTSGGGLTTFTSQCIFFKLKFKIFH